MDIPCLNSGDTCIDPSVPIGNYSSEAPDRDLFIGYNPPNVDPDLGTNWTNWGCLGIQCLSEISQEDADLCALRQAILCLDPNAFMSDPQTASSSCSDGTTFTTTVAGGSFASLSAAEAANAAALSYAQRLAETSRVCLTSIDRCTCLGVPYSQTIEVDTGSPVIFWSLESGSIPEGLEFFGGPTSNGRSRLSGTPTQNGTYTFTIRATTQTGSYSQREFVIVVLEITTETIDPYTIGEPYSFQLQADGGSGNYAWRVSNGSLPAGLTVSSTGLISGTPTSAGSSSIQFQVIDTTCEAINRSFFTPLASVVGSSTTTVRTRRGYSEYTSGGTGDLYKTVTYTGYARQRSYAENPDGTMSYSGGAQYIYSGSSSINSFGSFVSSHRKDLYVSCLEAPVLNVWDIFQNISWVNYLLGYCWPDDPTTCDECSEDEGDWAFKQNDATHNPADNARNIIAANAATTISPTSYSIVVPAGGTTAPMYLGSQPDFPNTYPNPTNYPLSTLNGITWYYVNLRSEIDYTATLSNPFTEADEVAGQIQYSGNGLTSENRPAYISWTQDYINNIASRFTSANFTINCSNLVDGESYTVNYQFWRNDGFVSNQAVVFTASGETHTINGSLPTPPAGMTITLRNVRISYSA